MEPTGNCEGDSFAYSLKKWTIFIALCASMLLLANACSKQDFSPAVMDGGRHEAPTGIRQEAPAGTTNDREHSSGESGQSGVGASSDMGYPEINLFQRAEVEAPLGPIYVDSPVVLTVVLVPMQNLQEDTRYSYVHPYVERAIREHWPLDRGGIRIVTTVQRNAGQILSFNSEEEMDEYDRTGWMEDDFPINLKIVGISDHYRSVKNELREQNPSLDPIYFQPEYLWFAMLIDTTLQDLFAGDNRFPMRVTFPKAGQYMVSLQGNWTTESNPSSFDLGLTIDADKRIDVVER